MSYKSYYVWPNKAFPFREYFSSEHLRIFIIENLQHNYEWLKEYKSRIRSTDFFFVILGSHWEDGLVKNACDMFDFLALDKSKFFILFNDERDKYIFRNSGLAGEIINQNAWLDYNTSMKVLNGVEKRFDAIYVGRLIKVKRHYLAGSVRNLALVSGILYGNNVEEPEPPNIYRNVNPLTPDEVCHKINSAHCGLILSEKEGACFASSEYLLCGVPVVSTQSEGGRAVWYDDYNSIVCRDDPTEIQAAVEDFVKNPRDPQVIRTRHINKANRYRARFVELLATLFEQYGVQDVNPIEYFLENFFHKMRKSYQPNFEVIFRQDNGS